jgi:energy-coupling factor transporter ATP-binding protein EcfA2
VGPARAESLELNRVIYGIDRAAAQKTIDELTELLDVRDKLDVMVRELSLGERMKMELIAALLHRPKVLFLDEPTIGLDVVSQKKVREFLREYTARNRITTLLTSHYMQDIEELCERVIIIHRSRLAHYGETMVRITAAAISGWRDGEVRDLALDLNQLTLAVVGHTLFSSDVGGAADSIAAGFDHLVTDLNRMIFPGAALALRSPLPFARRIRRSQSELDRVVYDLIRSRRAQLADTGDLLSTLLLAEDAERPGERLRRRGDPKPGHDALLRRPGDDRQRARLGLLAPRGPPRCRVGPAARAGNRPRRARAHVCRRCRTSPTRARS